MDASFLSGTNPVLTRELRVILRNTRTFALLALYVAALGAIVVGNFPSDTDIPLQTAKGGGADQGIAMLWTFFYAQAALVLLLLPALATGALAQERERQTLEPLLLTPLTPLQILWGKASGVLALAALLLLSTLPLTSLCFLLGGVSPAELITAYAVLLGLALFTTGFGLYCAAKWQSATQATVACYLMLPMVSALVVLFAFPGALVSGILFMGWGFYLAVVRWRRWSTAPWPRRMGAIWWLLFWLMMIVFWCALIFLMLRVLDLGKLIIGIGFVASYLMAIAYWGLREAAREVARRPEPLEPMRERLQDFKEEWQRAVAPPPVVYLPEPTGRYTYTPQAPPPASRPVTETYGVEPFLSDRLNPIYAKDMRNGLLGKFKYLLRFSYVVTIGSELLLLLLVLGNAQTQTLNSLFAGWAQVHLMLLMMAGAWFGSRGLAPEREQQTLQQLLTAPLPASTIVQGKMMSVMVHTFYVFIMAVPLVLLLPSLGEMPWRTAFSFLFLELALGAFAAAWGLYCSLQCVTVRRALGYALGGVLALMLAGSMLTSVLLETVGTMTTRADFVADMVITASDWLLPFRALAHALAPVNAGPMVSTAPSMPGAYGMIGFDALSLLVTLFLYSVAALTLLVLTSRAFKRYAQTV